jgi:hypothetical protein
VGGESGDDRQVSKPTTPLRQILPAETGWFVVRPMFTIDPHGKTIVDDWDEVAVVGWLVQAIYEGQYQEPVDLRTIPVLTGCSDLEPYAYRRPDGTYETGSGLEVLEEAQVLKWLGEEVYRRTKREERHAVETIGRQEPHQAGQLAVEAAAMGQDRQQGAQRDRRRG